MIVDAHAHIVSSDFASYPIAPLAGDLRPGSLDDPFTVQRLLDDGATAGVFRAVVVQRAHIYGYDNSYVLDSAHRHRGRIAAVCCIDAERPGAAPLLEHLVRDRGVAGVRLTVPVGSPNGGQAGTDWFASTAARTVWRRAAEFGIPVCLHLFGWNRDIGLRTLAGLMRDIPDVDVVLDHVGNADIEEGLEYFSGSDEILALVDLPRLHVKVTTLNFTRLTGSPVTPAALLAFLVARFGADRVLWGSDVTQTPGSYADLVAQARAATSDLAPSDAEWVLGRTAATLYPSGVPVR
jgi:L-fuconolactonase